MQRTSAAALKDQNIYASLVAACSQIQLTALPTKLEPLKASFAVDTGAVVNVLSEKAYKLIKRASRGSRCALRPNDLNLMSVSIESLNILGVVRLPIVLGKGTSRLCLDFYVVSVFLLALRWVVRIDIAEVQPDGDTSGHKCCNFPR